MRVIVVLIVAFNVVVLVVMVRVPSAGTGVWVVPLAAVCVEGGCRGWVML